MTDQAPYGWIITKDHLAAAQDDAAHTDAGVLGPRAIAPTVADALRAGAGQPFRMYDDDGVLYYEGRLVGAEYPVDHPGWMEWGLQPLHEFGLPNAGCTEIRYLEDGVWRTL